MNFEEYRTMREVEDGFWWYTGFRRTYGELLDRFCPGEVRGRVLDAGCGTGAFLAFLQERYEPDRLAGLDFSAEALRFCRERGYRDLVEASVTELPFPDTSFDFVASLDVLCHRSIPDDLVPLREFRRVLRPGGCLLLNLPAFPSIYSEHDVAVHTCRRYRRPEVMRKLREAGLEPLWVTYANSILFPAVAAVRIMGKRSLEPEPEEAKSDLKPLPPALNSLLAGVLGVEARLAGRVRMPFGSSVTAVARAV